MRTPKLTTKRIVLLVLCLVILLIGIWLLVTARHTKPFKALFGSNKTHEQTQPNLIPRRQSTRASVPRSQSVTRTSIPRSQSVTRASTALSSEYTQAEAAAPEVPQSGTGVGGPMLMATYASDAAAARRAAAAPQTQTTANAPQTQTTANDGWGNDPNRPPAKEYVLTVHSGAKQRKSSTPKSQNVGNEMQMRGKTKGGNLLLSKPGSTFLGV